jgi:hypothetical protein
MAGGWHGEKPRARNVLRNTESTVIMGKATSSLKLEEENKTNSVSRADLKTSLPALQHRKTTFPDNKSGKDLLSRERYQE